MMHGTTKDKRLCGVTIPLHTRGNGRVPLYTHTWMHMFTLFDGEIDKTDRQSSQSREYVPKPLNSLMSDALHPVPITNK